MFFDPVYLLIIAPFALLAGWAQFKVQSTFAKASQIAARVGMTGAEVAQQLMKMNGIYDVEVGQAQGFLGDHYDPTRKVLNLSDNVYHGRSLAALAVAAHEAGHAMQHAQGYAPLALRSAAVPVASFGSNFAWILFMIGLFMAAAPLGKFLMLGGIALFAGAVFFALVTLPVEFDASKRAIAQLQGRGFLSEYEVPAAKSVLNAAALTYVAAAGMAIAQLLYLLMRYAGVSRDE